MFSLTDFLNDNPEFYSAYNDVIQYVSSEYGENSDELKLSKQYLYNAFDMCRDEKCYLCDYGELRLRKASIYDSDFIGSVELDSDNSPWIAHWDIGRRIETMGNPDFLQTVIETTDCEKIGFIIFRDLLQLPDNLQLKRIAIIKKGIGLGVMSLKLAEKFVFECIKAQRLYLSTKYENIRAQNIYKKVGFVLDEPESCALFSMTEPRYRQLTNDA